MISIGQKYKCIIDNLNHIIQINKTDADTMYFTVIDAGNCKNTYVGLMSSWNLSNFELKVSINEWALVSEMPEKISNKISDKNDGMFCSGGCSNFFPMAIANQSDGTLKCFVCRNRS